MKTRIAIIGGGFCGVTTLIQLLHKTEGTLIEFDITLFESDDRVGRGIAYSTENIHHLLNVPAIGMSALPDNLHHFAEWLHSNGYDYQPNDFVPRKVYGDYLSDTLNSYIHRGKSHKVTIEKKEVSSISSDNKNEYNVDGKTFDKVVLAVGANFKKIHQLPNFWENSSIDSFLDKKEINIIGSGLSMIDCAISFQDAGYKGTINCYSRNILLPNIHKAYDVLTKPTFDFPSYNRTLKSVISFINHHRKQTDWRAVIDGLRPFNQQIWHLFSEEDKALFLRKFSTLWSVHRHRIAPQQQEKFNEMVQSGKVTLNKIKRGDSIAFDINCAGFEFNPSEWKNPMISKMIQSGLLVKGDMDMGVKPSSQPGLYILGALLVGEWFETTAVPELRFQCKDVADRIIEEVKVGVESEKSMA